MNWVIVEEDDPWGDVVINKAATHDTKNIIAKTDSNTTQGCNFFLVTISVSFSSISSTDDADIKGADDDEEDDDDDDDDDGSSAPGAEERAP